MVLTTENTEVETTLEGKTFSIEDNVVLYNILSDRMYKNKIRAVVRELSTNAVDAHIEAGTTDTPIKVQMPTILEPVFKIRDYGIGLSEDDVMSLYTTYGASTKRNSNMFNGALGLGSKSPFAYAKAFSVSSHFNGMKYMFSVYSDNGMPKIAKLGETTTTEPNGLEIEIPTNDNDVYKFEDEAKFVYKFFNHDIECNIELGIPIKDQEATIMRDNWAIYPNIIGSWIVMANVAYNLQNVDIPNGEILNTNGLVVTVDTGDVQFSASREELSLTPETIDYLKKLAVSINDGLEAEVSEKLADGELKLMEAVKIAKTLPRELRKSVPNYYPNISMGYYGGIEIVAPSQYTLKKKPSWRDRYESFRYVTEEMLTDKEYIFILNDVKSRMSHIKSVETRKLIFVDTATQKVKGNKKSRFDDFIDALGLTDSKYEYASNYELPKRERAVKSATPAVVVPKERLVDLKRVEKWSWSVEQEAWGKVEGYDIPDGAFTDKNYAVYQMIENYENILNSNGQLISSSCTNLLQLCFKYNNGIDKSKTHIIVVQNMSQSKKYIKEISKSWTALLPNKIEIYDVTDVVGFMAKVGFELKRETDFKGEFTLAEPLVENIMPRDLKVLMNKINRVHKKAVHKSDIIYNYQTLQNAAKVTDTKIKVSIKRIEYSSIFEKYRYIINNVNVGWRSEENFLRAKITKLVDMGLHKVEAKLNS